MRRRPSSTSRVASRDRAYWYLRDKVLSDPAVIGTFIVEQDVADEVGVSRTPVREALLMLAAEELVQLMPNHGAFVAPLTAEDTSEIMQARAVIESWAGRRCLEVGTVPTDELRAQLQRQAELTRIDQAVEFIDADRAFHVALVAAAGNPILLRLYESLRARHLLLGVRAMELSATRAADVLAEHQRIFDALTGTDPGEVEAAITAHIGVTQQVLVRGGLS